MIRFIAAAALLCVSISAHAMDPRCNGSARYDAMRDADFSGHGTGHACAEPSANFLEGVRSIDVTMHRVKHGRHGRAKARSR